MALLSMFFAMGNGIRGADPLPFILDFPPVDGAKAYEVQWLTGPVPDETKGSAGPVEKFEKPPFEKEKVGAFTHFRIRSLGPFGVPGRWSKVRPIPDFQKARVVRKVEQPVKRPAARKAVEQPPVADTKKAAPGFVYVVNGEGRKERYFTGHALGLGAADTRSGVRSIHFRVNGGPFRKYSSPIAFTGDGVYRLRYYALDRAGNREPVQYMVFRVDRTPPVTRVAFAREPVRRNDRLFSGKANKIELLGYDEGSGLKEIRYRVFTDPARPGPYLIYSRPLLFADILRAGTQRHIIEFFALDKLGNRAKTRRVVLVRR